jgi:hypothetical protein
LLTVSTRIARAGTDGFLFLTEKTSQMAEFQKAVVEQVELRERLRTYGGKPVKELLDRVSDWEKIVQ